MKLNINNLKKEATSLFKFIYRIVVVSKVNIKKHPEDSWKKMEDNYGILHESSSFIPSVRDRDDIFNSNISLELKSIDGKIQEVMDYASSKDYPGEYIFSWEKVDKISERLDG